MPSPSGRILIVDDEVQLLVVMEQYLRRLGHDVVACRSGEEAWEKFSADPTVYWLVLADITMGEMSGQEMLLRMIELNSDICVIICSGYPFDASVLPESMRDRVTFLQKPFTPRMLAECVDRLRAACADEQGR